MKLIKKYSIKEEDLYILSYIEWKKGEVNFFEKEKLKFKSLGILKPYNVKFVDLGILLNEIKVQSYHENSLLVDKYGEVNLNSKSSSIGVKYLIPIFFFSLVVFGFITFLFTADGNKAAPNNCSAISGTYSGTSIMGYTQGTAEIVIDTDCNATLSYSQGSYGKATERGKIETSGTIYKFNKYGEGSYDLTIASNKIILDGYNWQCIMTK